MSERQAVVLLVAREGLVHRLLGALLADDCAFLGARTANAALQLVRQRRPDVIVVDDSFEDLDALMAGLQEGAPGFRAIVLATPNRPGTRVARLAKFGPVIAKPFENEHLRTLVLTTAQLAVATEDSAEPGPFSARAAAHSTTKVQVGRRAPTDE